MVHESLFATEGQMSTAEDIYEDGKREDREDALIAQRERRIRNEPPIGEMCGTCYGRKFVEIWEPGYYGDYPDSMPCPTCRGEGVL